MDSVCYSCVYRMYTPAHISADPSDDYPEEDWCEEDSSNFQTRDGCYQYEPRSEEY